MKVKTIVIFGCIVAGLLVIDMLSKVFTDGIDHTNIIPGLIGFVSVYNFGISFSLFSGTGIWLIVIVSILTLGAIIAWWILVGRKKEGGKGFGFANIAFAFFIAGAIGNLYDRIAYGYVRDFIQFDFWSSFPIFNFADICLTSGTIMLAVFLIFFMDTKEKKNAA